MSRRPTAAGSLPIAGSAARVIVDVDVERAYNHVEWRHLAGRVVGVAGNEFFDLATMIGGTGAAPRDSNPVDLRRANLVSSNYRTSLFAGTDGSSSMVAVEIDCDRPLPSITVPSQDPEAPPRSVVGSSGLTFLPLEVARYVPNISVDSIDNRATRMVLSHWPSNRTPAQYKANLSARSVFAFLAEELPTGDANAVVTDHFDIDGLVGIHAFLEPQHALPRAELLIDVARCGDFARFSSRTAARIVFATNALAGQAASAFDEEFGGGRNGRLSFVFSSVLERFASVLDQPERYENFWSDEDSMLDSAESLFSDGRIVVTEDADIDLAVFRIDASIPISEQNVVASLGPRYLGLPCAAFHNRTRRSNIALLARNQRELWQRYEGWVERANQAPRPRRDLSVLARALSRAEGMQGLWEGNGPEALTPRLRMPGAQRSTLEEEPFLDAIVDFLRLAPPAWKPDTPPL